MPQRMGPGPEAVDRGRDLRARNHRGEIPYIAEHQSFETPTNRFQLAGYIPRMAADGARYLGVACWLGVGPGAGPMG